MKLNVPKEVAALQRLTLRELRNRFALLFGEARPTGNRGWLVKRILWRMQALAEGDLSERARQRAAELANDADLRILAPPTPAKINDPPPQAAPPAPECQKSAADPRPSQRLPMAGTVLTRIYKGRRLEVRVLPDGFDFEGAVYPSLSALANAITGAHWNGRLFFGLHENGGKR